MPVQRFAPMRKDFATFDCDAHVTEPPLIWERAAEFLLYAGERRLRAAGRVRGPEEARPGAGASGPGDLRRPRAAAQEVKGRTDRRIRLLLVILLVAFATALGRAVWLQAIHAAPEPYSADGRYAPYITLAMLGICALFVLGANVVDRTRRIPAEAP